MALFIFRTRKILNLRLFSDGDARWKKSVKDEKLEILCVSQVRIYQLDLGIGTCDELVGILIR